MTREEIIQRHPLVAVVQERGMKLRKQAGELYGSCPFHQDGGRPNFRINIEKQLWTCDVCGIGGSVIDFVMQADKLTMPAAMAKLGGDDHPSQVATGAVRIVATYPYTDENGVVLFEVLRFEPKTFRQRHTDAAGKVQWTMDGVRRVLYRLPAVLASEQVVIVEGEKDADNLTALGLVATCNVGGAKKWMDSYSETLKGKTVIVWPDNDKPGQEHADLVIKSLTGKAKSIARVKVEEKDASDFIAAGPTETALDRVQAALSSAKTFNPADDVPIKSFLDLELEYQLHAKHAETTCLDLGKWLPTLRRIRPLVPGELISIISDTGSGKTAILQNIAHHAFPIPTLIFELELPGPLMFERTLQIDQGFTGAAIFNSYRNGTPLAFHGESKIQHLHFCLRSKMTLVEMETIINRAELRMGVRPLIVMVDYIQLLGMGSTSRYERVSEAAESLKVMAKETNVIMFFASQVSRKSKDAKSKEVFLHDGKDSGSVENSSGLLLGAWREGEDEEIMQIKVLKNTKGRSGGKVITCNFNGETLQITERAPVSEEDVPPRRKVMNDP